MSASNDADVFRLAALLLNQRGLCKTHLYAHHAGLSENWATGPKGKARGTSTVGAVKSACVHLERIKDTVRLLRGFRVWLGVGSVVEVEAGKATKDEVVAKLYGYAATLPGAGCEGCGLSGRHWAGCPATT